LYEEVCELALEDCHVPAGATKRPRPVAHIIPSPPLDRLLLLRPPQLALVASILVHFCRL
jgi:hypothetical protein